MLELLRTSVTGVNIIPTALLGLVVLYWLTVIIGVLDIDFLDFDIDTDIDVDGAANPFQGFLAFLNFGGVPVMLVLSIIFLCFWVLSMLAHLLPFETGGVMGAVLFIPSLLISIAIAKLICKHLAGLFVESHETNSKAYELEGKLCTLLCELSLGRLGQAEVMLDNAFITINVKLEEPQNLQKGDSALVLKKDPDKDFYIITKFERMG